MPASRKRERSPSAETPAEAVALTDATSTLSRSDAEWEKLENGSVLLLPPTISIVREVLHTSLQDGAAYVVKIAAFDMDDTLIKPASGAVFPKDDPNDWQWVHADVPTHLQRLHESGFLIVLFSNQMGIGKASTWNAVKAAAIQSKVVRLSRNAAVPLCACVATRDDCWRKPNPRLWKLVTERVAQCVQVGREAPVAVDCEAYSFYVGDAAGRPTPTLAGRKKDFSCSDRHFAYNLKLPFFTPEQVFQTAVDDLLQEDSASRRIIISSSNSGDAAETEKQRLTSYRLSTTLLQLTAATATAGFSWGDVSPEELASLPRTYANLTLQVITATRAETRTLPAASPFFAPAGNGRQEMILFVGYPGCGKSTFFRRHLQPQGYRHVNRDALQTRAKCLRAAEEYWSAGHSVVVDNTNPTAEDRQAYMDIVKKHTKGKKGGAHAGLLPVRIFCFTHTRGLAQHMNTVRSHVEGVARVPTIAFNVFNARLQRPTTPAEVAALGIDSVWEIPPVACFAEAPAGTENAFFLLL